MTLERKADKTGTYVIFLVQFDKVLSNPICFIPNVVHKTAQNLIMQSSVRTKQFTLRRSGWHLRCVKVLRNGLLNMLRSRVSRRKELEFGASLENFLDFVGAGNWNCPVTGNLLSPPTQVSTANHMVVSFPRASHYNFVSLV